MPSTPTGALRLAALLVAALGSPAPLLAGPGPASPSGTPAPAPQAAPSPPSPEATSVLSLPLTVSLNRLFAVLRKLVPEKEDRWAGWSEVPAGSGRMVRYAWNRGPLDLELGGLRFSAATRIDYRLEFGMPWNRLNPFSRSTEVQSLASIGSGSKPSRVDMRFETGLEVGEDWRLRSRTRIEPTLVDAVKIKAMGLDVSGWITPVLQAMLADKAADFDRKVAERLDLRPFAEKLWKRLTTPLALTGEGTWLRIRPVGFSISPLEVEGDAVRLVLQLRAAPEIGSGPLPATTAVAPLPPLTPAGPERGLRLALGVGLDFASASHLLSRVLVGKSLAMPLGPALAVRRLAIDSESGRLRLAVDVTGPFEGRLALAGSPRFDPASGDLTVPDLDYALETTGFLARMAEAMVAERIRSELRQRTRWNLGGQLRKLERSGSRALNRPLGDGLSLSGKLGSLGLDALEVDAQGIRIRIQATGEAALRADAALDRALEKEAAAP